MSKLLRNTKNNANNLHKYDLYRTYTWPSSWVIVNAADKPLSSMIAQLRNESHMVPSSARPSVSHFPGALSFKLGINSLDFYFRLGLTI